MRSAFWLVSFAVVACSSPEATPAVAADAAPDASDGADTAGDDCDRFAAAICTSGFHCSWFFEARYSSAAACLEHRARTCRESLSLPGQIDPGDHAACIAGLETTRCGALVPACRSRPGTLPNGASCVVGSQCATAYCGYDEKGCGTCRAQPVAGVPCAREEDCSVGGEDLYCDLGTRRCVALPSLGERCEPWACARDLTCVEGTCRPRPTAGQPCSDRVECAEDLACLAGTCTPHRVVGIGEPCDDARVCRGDARCRSGVCVATQPLGGACGSLVDCAWWATCSGGKCVEGPGAACPTG